MTDRELLELCREAFQAIPLSAAARKMLKKMGQIPGAYAGNGSHILARAMVVEIDKHTGDA